METTNQLSFRKFEFIGPSGNSYTIREQNGDDDDILSNSDRAKTLHNISDFISAIVVNTSVTSNGKLTSDQAHALPSNDRYAIMFNSRIFSLGANADFEYDWGQEYGGKFSYSQDLNEFLFDYGTSPSKKTLEEKPDAIPFYPDTTLLKDISITLSSGKELTFDLLDGNGDTYLVNLPVRTKNSTLKARNLKLIVNGQPELVERFTLFTPQDMMEIRKRVEELDPIFTGQIDIPNPLEKYKGLKTSINIITIPGFFYPGEI